jgi:DNA-binding XRE family transcriptional regulator
MSRVQVIEKDGKPDFYLVPADLWERVRGMVEDAEDAAAYADAVARDDGLRYPAAVALALADGTPALKAWREHKGLTLQALADATQLSRAFLSQIETGKRTGSAATLKKLADALGVPVGALIEL